MNQYLDVNPEVAQAVAQGKPVVALESTIISHGMPYPQNVETALQVEQIIRENGAVPATIAILGRPAEGGSDHRGDRVPGQAGPGSDQGLLAGTCLCWWPRERTAPPR